MNNLDAAIEGAIKGDIDQMPLICLACHSDLRSAAEKLSRLTLSRPALIKVLNTWRSGDCTSENVQRWASFMRRGYVSRASDNGVRPIAIDYDASDEDLIVEIIGRLDQIGDKIDGAVDEAEREDMLKILEA